MDMQIDRPTRFLEWAHRTFGDVALDPQERAMRFFEEAAELGHALDLSAATLGAIVTRVCSRPTGEVGRELGQSLCTLELLAKAIGIDAEAEATREFTRVQSIPQAEWDRRHAAKVAIGIAK
jgi:NTP pyrophosphatase (non-canonical NTP hydrolase)